MKQHMEESLLLSVCQPASHNLNRFCGERGLCYSNSAVFISETKMTKGSLYNKECILIAGTQWSLGSDLLFAQCMPNVFMAP